MKVEYVGPRGEVEVPSLGLTFSKGSPVEVDAATAEGLLVQSDNFKRVGADKPAKENK